MAFSKKIGKRTARTLKNGGFPAALACLGIFLVAPAPASAAGTEWGVFSSPMEADESHGKARAESAQHGEAHEPATEAEHAHGGRPHHRNELALFVGATDESGHDVEPTLGLEYSRAVADRWAVGGLVDYAGGELRNLVVGVPLIWRPGGGWKLLAAPGVELHRGRDGEGHAAVRSGGQGGADEDESHFLVRFGAAYAFHFGERYGVEPSVAIDLVDGEEVWVAGFNMIVGW